MTALPNTSALAIGAIIITPIHDRQDTTTAMASRLHVNIVIMTVSS